MQNLPHNDHNGWKCKQIELINTLVDMFYSSGIQLSLHTELTSHWRSSGWLKVEISISLWIFHLVIITREEIVYLAAMWKKVVTVQILPV